MATGTAKFSGEVFSFEISYEYTNTSFKFTGVTVTGTSKAPYWTTWEQTPTLYIYALKGSNPVPKSYQSGADNLDSPNAKEYITSRGGKYQKVIESNNPSDYLPNTAGGTKKWSSGFKDIVLSLSGSSVTITVGAYIANTTGTLNDVVYGSDTFTLSLYTAPSGYSLSCAKIDDITENTMKVSHKWTAGSDSITSNKIVIDRYDYIDGEWKTGYRDYSGLGNGKEVTFGASTNMASNSYYKITGTISDGTKTLTDTIYRWTKPKILASGLSVSLKKGSEHDVIIATAEAANPTPYDQFNFSKDGGKTWTGWTDRAKSATHTFSGLAENTKYEIAFKMRNARKEGSDYWDTEFYAGGINSPTVISKSLTTWYDPISELIPKLTIQEYWKLGIKADVTYNGTISSYQFKIYKKDSTEPAYTSESSTNSYSKGTSTGGNSSNLVYNTDYICKVKVKDNHGRTKEATATYKTLDERPLYVNGTLREVKLIKSDGTVKYITPNLLSVIKSNGTVVTMDDIINPDRVK